MGGQRDKPDRIGAPDPENEPVPPKVDDAGDLGEVGLRKREAGEDSKEKKGIWGDRPPTPDEDPTDPAARTRTPLPE
jgi:hypothetical protein